MRRAGSQVRGGCAARGRPQTEAVSRRRGESVRTPRMRRAGSQVRGGCAANAAGLEDEQGTRTDMSRKQTSRRPTVAGKELNVVTHHQGNAHQTTMRCDLTPVRMEKANNTGTRFEKLHQHPGSWAAPVSEAPVSEAGSREQDGCLTHLRAVAPARRQRVGDPVLGLHLSPGQPFPRSVWTSESWVRGGIHTLPTDPSPSVSKPWRPNLDLDLLA
ncbi:uncharacterized protein LOC144229621 [Crocuta crocuta]